MSDGDDWRTSLLSFFFTRETVELWHELKTEARERAQLAPDPPVNYPMSTTALTLDYWPTDGSWHPAPKAAMLINDDRFSRSFNSLQTSLEERPISAGSPPSGRSNGSADNQTRTDNGPDSERDTERSYD